MSPRAYAQHLIELAQQLEDEARRAATHQMFSLSDSLRETSQETAAWGETLSQEEAI